MAVEPNSPRISPVIEELETSKLSSMAVEPNSPMVSLMAVIDEIGLTQGQSSMSPSVQLPSSSGVPLDISTPKSYSSRAPPQIKEWIPHCPPEYMPKIGDRYPTLDEGVQFYADYAGICGFSSRLASSKRMSDGSLKIRYCLCSREGYKKPSNPNVLRRRVVTRMGCGACIRFRLTDKGDYEVYAFVEAHSHSLATPISRQFLRGSRGPRKLHLGHKKFIFSNAKVNQGPTMSFRMWKEKVGSYLNVGASIDDFKNFYRDLRGYIKDSDGQMFIENLYRKKEISPAFFFDYELDDSGSLSMAFWADAISRKNYSLFGDAISFDTTYSTNKYNMIFAPFTGVDHHKLCVTFGAGLIAKEDVSSFTWLFETFLKAMSDCQPISIITDQDPAMKIAIAKVLDKSAHRYCVWHIMEKLQKNVSVELRSDAEFLKRMNRCVYNREHKRTDFEAEWKSILEEYQLEQNHWLKLMFGMKELWVPAYFRKLYMGGLLRTTSRSESENNFFNFFTNQHVTLVEFQMRFQSAMEAQRYKQSKFESQSKNSWPPLKTPLPLEKSASVIYTHNAFYEFQTEAYSACYECGFHDLNKDGDKETFTIVHFPTNKMYTVVYTSNEEQVHCSCKLFKRLGLVCRHSVWVLQMKGVRELPDSCVLSRWTKEATKKPIFDLHGTLLEECAALDDKDRILAEVWSEAYNCVAMAEDSIDDLSNILENLKLSSRNLMAKRKSKGLHSKTQELEQFLGCKAPATVTIKNPKQSNNKGSRKGTKGDRDVETKEKKGRQCAICGKIAGHNARTCPARKKCVNQPANCSQFQEQPGEQEEVPEVQVEQQVPTPTSEDANDQP